MAAYGYKKLIVFFLVCLAIPSIALDVPLQWDHACDCTGFRVYRSQGSADWPELVGTVQCPATTFTDTNVPNGELGYVVTAYTDTLESNASNEVLLAFYYEITKYDYGPSGEITYIGENHDRTASDSDTDWVITKIYYDATGRTIMRVVKTGSWTTRTEGW